MERLAQAIKRAAQIREKSFDHEGLKKEKAKRLSGYVLLDIEQFYKITLWDACEKATEEFGFDTRGTAPVYLLLRYSWNNALEWAEATIKIKG